MVWTGNRFIGYTGGTGGVMRQGHGSQRKRTDKAASASAIVHAATELFLRNGYRETSTDQIAALAGVSKQTIYRNFPDKEILFDSLMRGVIERAQSFLRDMTLTLENPRDLRTGLREVARRYVATVFQPPVLQLRRLLISEARGFPKLALSYYRQVPEHTLSALATAFQRLAGKGFLRIADPRVAARHFAALLIMLPLDRAMFGVRTSTAALERQAYEGIDMFLTAYGTRPSRSIIRSTPQPRGAGRSGGLPTGRGRSARR